MIINKNNLKFPRAFGRRTSTDSIIVHHAAAVKASMQEIHQWHLDKGWNGFAYNFYIPKVGGVWEGRPIWAADSDSMGHNFDSLSIVFEGNFNIEFMAKAQINTGSELIRFLRGQYPSVRKVLCHRDVGKTDCPGKNFDMQVIIQGLQDPTNTVDVMEAITKLHKHGIINNPLHWEVAIKNTQYLGQLMINMANYIKG
jgi:hypothetical protein